MKTSRPDRRRVTLRYVHDPATGRTTLTIDVEAPEDDMPHEHRQDLKSMAGEILGIPVDELPDDVVVNLRRASGGHDHPHPHPDEGELDEALPRDEAAAGRTRTGAKT